MVSTVELFYCSSTKASQDKASHLESSLANHLAARLGNLANRFAHESKLTYARITLL